MTATKSIECLATFKKTEGNHRQYCTECGGHLRNNHPGLGLIDVFAATLPTFDFQPSVHYNYSETVLWMKGGLPKFENFPKESGGSGETIAD